MQEALSLTSPFYPYIKTWVQMFKKSKPAQLLFPRCADFPSVDPLAPDFCRKKNPMKQNPIDDTK